MSEPRQITPYATSDDPNIKDFSPRPIPESDQERLDRLRSEPEPTPSQLAAIEDLERRLRAAEDQIEEWREDDAEQGEQPDESEQGDGAVGKDTQST